MSISKQLKHKNMLGQGMTEYIIIVALIAIAAIGVFSYFGQTARNQVAGMATELSGNDAGAQIGASQAAAGLANTQGQQKDLGSYNANGQ